jgi:hypothetical protein
MADRLTTAERAALKAIVNGGIRTVTYGNRTITYSIEEAAKRLAEDDAASARAGGTSVKYTIARFCRAG